MNDWSSPWGRLRHLGRIEGVSFLLLLGVAMPLKYLAGIALAVKIMGWLHGVLFMALGISILQAWAEAVLDLRRALLVLVAAFVPFGPFLIDRQLQNWARASSEG